MSYDFSERHSSFSPSPPLRGTLGVGCSNGCVGHWTWDTGMVTWDIGRWMLEWLRGTLGVGCSNGCVGHWAWGARMVAWDIGRWMLECGRGILEWLRGILDVGYSNGCVGHWAWDTRMVAWDTGRGILTSPAGRSVLSGDLRGTLGVGHVNGWQSILVNGGCDPHPHPLSGIPKISTLAIKALARGRGEMYGKRFKRK